MSLLKKAGIGCGGLLAVIIIIALVAQGGGASKAAATPVAQATSATDAGASPTATTGKSAQASTPAPMAVAPAKPTAATVPNQNPNGGIVFGKPVVVANSAGMSTVEVLATNTTDLVKSFTVKATFKTGDTIAATASGAVNDLLPGQKRAVNLISTDSIPSKYDSVRVDVDAMVAESKTTPGGNVAEKLKFGKPAVKSLAGLSTVEVEVTNGDKATHSFTVEAVFLQNGSLVGDAVGAVNDIAGGQTKTASLVSAGLIPAHDQVLVEADSVVK